jgi:polyphosphate kinase
MSEEKILIEALKNKDFLLHFPYHSFDHFIDLLREAAIDPKVFSIKITLYRVAAQSNVINALINAIKNGKSVTAIFELQARFDEEANIYWANVLRDVGARVIYGVPGLKVHAKLCLITRKEKGHLTHYVTMGTGNFNEVTATIYCDHMLFTSDKRLTLEVATMFEFFENNYKISKFKHLIVSPFFFRKKIYKLIENEIINAINGKKAYIYIKLNNLADNAIADKIFQASNAGVEIRLIVRGMFSKIPDFIETSPNIQAISIVDKFLEHSRIMIFCNDGAEKYYVSSSDWMTRNFDHRVEVAFPIFDPEIQKELKFYFDLQWRDNVKARVLNKALDNKYQKRTTGRAIRAQEEIYNYLKKK